MKAVAAMDGCHTGVCVCVAERAKIKLHFETHDVLTIQTLHRAQTLNFIVWNWIIVQHCFIVFAEINVYAMVDWNISENGSAQDSTWGGNKQLNAEKEAKWVDINSTKATHKQTQILDHRKQSAPLEFSMELPFNFSLKTVYDANTQVILGKPRVDCYCTENVLLKIETHRIAHLIFISQNNTRTI